MNKPHAPPNGGAGQTPARAGPVRLFEPGTQEREEIGLLAEPDEAPPPQSARAGGGKPPTPPTLVATGGMDDGPDDSRAGSQDSIWDLSPAIHEIQLGVEAPADAGVLLDEKLEVNAAACSEFESPLAVVGTQEAQPTLRGDGLWIGLSGIGIAAAAVALIAIILPMAGGSNLVDVLLSSM